MRLLGVEASDFLSYRRLDVDLSDVHQLAIIGKNGHGKSAILDAILWCLFAKGRGASDEMVREGAGSTYVRTTWERIVKESSTIVTITRSRSKESDESSLSVTIDGEEKSKSKIPLTQAYIEHLVGMGPKAMMAGPVMVQGDSAALLEALPAARKDLLVELFQLERWEGYHDEAKRRRKMVQTEQDHVYRELSDLDVQTEDFDELAIQRELDGLRSEVFGLTAELQSLTEKVMVLREQAAVLQERSRRAESIGSEIEELVTEMERLSAERQALVTRIDRAKNGAGLLIPDVPYFPSSNAVDALRARVEEIDETISQRKTASSTSIQLRRQLGNLQARAASQSPCAGDPPGCQYRLAAAEAAGELAELEERIAGYESEAAGLQDLVYQRSELAGRLAAEDKAFKLTMAEHVRLSALAASLTAQRDAASEVLASSVPRLVEHDRIARAVTEKHARLAKERLDLHQDEWAMADLAQQIRQSTEQATLVKEQVAELQKAITTTERFRDEMVKVVARRALLVDEQAALDARGSTLDILVKAFHRDGIPTLILETALPEIEGRANDVLARLPDDYSIRLDTKTATKSGTFKDELRVTVMTGGKERPYHMLSGGQRFRVDFAVRIALAAVIAARVEATVDTLWLDEPLGPLDREGQEAVADTLSAVADDFGLIVVVSHVADFNDRMESKLSVTMEDAESTAVLS